MPNGNVSATDVVGVPPETQSVQCVIPAARMVTMTRERRHVLESWHTWLQYFCLSGAIQLYAACAHFFVPVIIALLAFRNHAAVARLM
jgi:hypothetical protein